MTEQEALAIVAEARKRLVDAAPPLPADFPARWRYATAHLKQEAA